MLSKIQLLFVALFMCVASVNAQTSELVYKDYKWEKEPVLHTLSEDEKIGNYLILKDKLLIEYAYETSGELIMYETRHTIIRINNEEGIEEQNKIYIPASSILEEMNFKARTITSKGEIISLPSSAVKKVDNLENAGAFLIFAMEGVDSGSEIEYYYTNKKTARLQSARIMQNKKIKKDISVDIYSPENLVFEAKGYNGFPEFTVDSIVDERNHIHAKIATIDALEDEKYSAYEANRMRFQYVFAYNTGRSTARIYTWDNMGLDLYKLLYNFEKSETKAISKLISKLKISSMSSDEQKLRAFETYIKTTIDYKETRPITIDQVLQIKYGGENNLQRIYIAAANILNIPVQVVLTSSRMKRKFDGDFPTWSSLQEYLIYFPTLKKYLSATNTYSRLGFPPPQFTGNDGLFIKETAIGEMKTAISKVKKIGVPSVEKSHNNINSSVTFDPTTFTPTITMQHEFSGYSAFYTQPTIPYLDDKQKQEYLDEMAQFIGEEVVVKSVTLSGGEQKDVLVNPFIIDCVIEAPQLVENTKDKYIFKVGELIGPQQEMYQEKKRQSPVDVWYTHSYTRILKVTIPEGYNVNNLNDINIDKKLSVDGKVSAFFTSKYTLVGNILTITVVESYEAIFYPMSYFKAYREVINAAADFNKIAIILEKK